MKKHFDRIHCGKRFKCKTCDETFATKFSLQRHFISNHEKLSAENDVEIVNEVIHKMVPVAQQDAKISNQQQEIKELKIKLKHANDEIKKIRAGLLEKKTF